MLSVKPSLFSNGLIGLVGVVGGIMLPLMGLGVGLTQVVRGAINTPEAITQKMKGKVWDNVSLCAA